METRDWKESYLEQVRAQLHWKYAQPVVLQELSDHLQDQRDACLAQGMDGNAAEAEALRQMGDPVTVGLELDRVHLPKPAWEIMTAMAALAVASLCLWCFVFFDGNWSQWLWNPLKGLLLGAGLCALTGRMDVNRLAQKPWRLCLGAVAAMVLAMWISRKSSGGIRMYWGQYTALLLPLGYAGLVYALRGRGGRGLALCGAAYVPLLALCLMVPSFGGGIVLSLSAYAILLLAIGSGAFGPRKRLYTALVLAVTALLAAGFAALIWDRLSVLLRIVPPEQEENFMQQMVWEMLAHARPLGAGAAFRWGAASSEWLLRADCMQCDYLLAVVAYRCGWVAALGLLAASLGFAALCLRKALRQRTLWGRLLACAVAIPLTVQTLGYILSNLGYPLGSFELPLLSYGNAFTVIDCLLLGFLLAVCRCGSILRDRPPESRAPGGRAWKLTVDHGQLTIVLPLHRRFRFWTAD